MGAIKKKTGGFSRQQVAAAGKAQREASSRTPKAILAAYFPPDVTVGDITLQPVTMSELMAR